MPRTIRFHLDECCDPSIADGLRRRNIEVTTSQEAGLLEAEDEQQAAYGLAQDRVVFTHDADFLRLQAAGVPHHMEALPTEPRTPSVWVRLSGDSFLSGRSTNRRKWLIA